MPRGIPNKPKNENAIPKPPTTAPEGSAGDSGAAPAIEEGILEELTAGGAIKHVIEALGFELDAVAKLEIGIQHADGAARIRILGRDRSLHSRRIELPAEEVVDE